VGLEEAIGEWVVAGLRSRHSPPSGVVKVGCVAHGVLWLPLGTRSRVCPGIGDPAVAVGEADHVVQLGLSTRLGKDDSIALGIDIPSQTMSSRNTTVALAWSGGKDSALALSALRREGTEPVALLTTFTEDYDRVSMHGVRRELVRSQAEAAGLPLVEVDIPAACPNEVYEERMARALEAPPLDRVEAIAFADLFLEEIRAYREERLAGAERRALFPIWGRDTGELAREFIEDGFEAVLACVDPAQLDPSFVGRPFDEALLADLPPGVDPCGENGEFHSFVHAGPVFARPVEIKLGEAVTRDGFAFQDLIPRRRAPGGSAEPPWLAISTSSSTKSP
jgi:uncharacterized protein (TIGR00290 family)